MTRKDFAPTNFCQLSSKNHLPRIQKKLTPSLNLMFDPAVIVDLEGYLLITNDRLCETTGFRKEELVGKDLLKSKLFSSACGIRLRRKCLGKIERRDSAIFEIELNKKNDKKMRVEVKEKKIEIGKKSLKLIVFHDITDRWNREKTLMELDERYQSLCEDARILLLTSDLKGNICFANKLAETYGFINAIGKNMVDFVSEKSRSKLVSTHLNVVSGKKVEEEIEIITPKGVFIVEYFSSPTRKDGRITGCNIAMIDITNKKQVDKKLENYAASAIELQEAYRCQ